MPLSDVYTSMLPYIHRSQPVRISDLAQMIHLEVPTVSRHVAVLEREGIVSREPHQEDGRSSLLSLTPHGEETFRVTLGGWLDTIDDMLDEWDDERVGRFSEEFQQFAELLTSTVQELSVNGRTIRDARSSVAMP